MEQELSGYIFTLPLGESELDELSVAAEDSQLIAVDVPSKEDEVELKKPKPRVDKSWKPKKKFNTLLFIWRMIRLHIVLFAIVTCGLYAILHYGFKKSQQKVILGALAFCDDWKQLAFFFGIYLSFAVKKISDVTSHIPPTDKIANLVSIAVKNNRTQKGIMKYICTSIAMVFSFLSPLVKKRLDCSERKIKAKLEGPSKKLIEKIEKKLSRVNINSSHFMPIKWSLHMIREAQERGEINEQYVNMLISEINALHTQCDRLINFKHETFSWGITIGALISVYTYFSVGAIRQLWGGFAEHHSLYLISASFFVNFMVFLGFLIVLRSAEQIVAPYNVEHDVFELNRILNEKLEVSAFVLNKECDLRKKMKDSVLLP